jgi:hypothetical protein
MYLLPCPSCQASIPLSPSQAGNETSCPACQSSVTVPKLGDLRQLPQAEQDSSVDRPQGVPISSGGSTGFAILGLIATASLVVAAFCGIRWSLIEVSSSTEAHIADYREAYRSLTAAQLIREYEQMEGDGFELAGPSPYKVAETNKRVWGRNASIAAAIGGLSLLGAFAIAGSGRRNQTS